MKDWTGNSRSTFAALAASNHAQNERETNDYYATEPKALELLLEQESFDPFVWECACGEGHLSEVLRQHSYIVHSTDLIDRGYGVGGVDFLKETAPFNGDIITNPPYKFAQEFVEHALSLIPTGNKVAMFLKLTFLEGQGRRKMFEMHPPPKGLCCKRTLEMRYERRVREVRQEYRCLLCVVYLGERLPRRSRNQMV